MALQAALSGGDLADCVHCLMLGLRSAPKEDRNASTIGLVLGQPLRISGKFLLEGSARQRPPATKPTLSDNALTVHHCFPKSFVPAELRSTSFVFVPHGSYRLVES